MKAKEIADKVKGKVKELKKKFGEAIGSLGPQPELVPIPVRNPSGRRPQPRREYW